MAFLRDFDCEASHPAAGKGRARLDPDEFLDDGVNRIEPRETFLAMTRCAGRPAYARYLTGLSAMPTRGETGIRHHVRRSLTPTALARGTVSLIARQP